MTRKWWLATIFIFIIAIALRAYQLGSVPTGIYWDEVAILVDARSVAETGRDMHGRVWYQVMYPSYGDYKLPVYIWLATASVKLLGVSVFALRLPSMLAGILTIGTAGFISYLSLNNAKTSKAVLAATTLGTMLTVAISPWSVMFSRTAFEGHVGQLLLALSVLALLGSKRWIGLRYLSPVLGALATYTYFSVRFVWPVVFVAYTVWLWWSEGQRTKGSLSTSIIQSLMRIGVPLILFVLMLYPMANSPLYEDSNRFRLGTDSVLKNEEQILQSNVYREMAGNTPLDRVAFHRGLLTGQELLKNYSDNLSLRFMFIDGDPNLRHGTGMFGLFLWPMLPVFFWGWYQLWDKHRGLSIVLGLWWLAALLPASVPENTPHALRTLNALVPLSVVIGTGLGYGLPSVLQKRNVFKSAFFILWSSISLVVFLSFVHFYFVMYPQASATAWQHGYPEVAESILQLQQNTPVYIEPFDDKFYLWMMAFGPDGGKEFQSWESFSYQFRTIGDITFRPFPGWGGELEHSSRVVIAGPAERIDELLDSGPFTVLHVETINDPAQQSVFKVVTVDKKL